MIASPERSRSQRMFAALVVPLLLGTFYLVDHTWDASRYFELEFDGTENVTADRLQAVDSTTTAARFMLAGFAAVGLLLPAPVRLDFRKPLLWTLVLYYGWLGCSPLWSVEPRHTLFKLAVLLIFLFTAFGISRQLSSDALLRVLAACCCGFIAIGFVAELAQGTFQPWRGDYRFTGTVHPNTQSVYAAIICLAGFLLYRGDQSWSTNIRAMVLILFGVVILLLTKSRTAVGAMLIGIVALQLVRLRGRQRVYLLLGVVTLAVVGVTLVSALGNRARSQLGSAAALGRDDDVTTLTGRLPLWEELMDRIAERPVLGYGYLGFWDAERVEDLGETFQWEIPHGHNLYLDVLLDGGVIGLFLLLLLDVTVVATAARRYQRTLDAGGLLVVGLLFFALVHGFGESIFKLTTFPTFALLTLIFGLLWEPRRGAEEREVESAADHCPREAVLA